MALKQGLEMAVRKELDLVDGMVSMKVDVKVF